MVTLPYRGEGPPVSLLLLVSSVGGNIPTRHLLDDRVFQTHVVVPEFYDSKEPLPPHQVVFNAIGDADLAAPALAAAQSLVALSQAPVINPPAAVLATGRADHARLARLPGVVVPLTVTLPRELLCSLGRPSRGGPPRLPFPAAGAHARFSHRPPFSAGGKRRRAGRRRGATAGAGNRPSSSSSMPAAPAERCASTA